MPISVSDTRANLPEHLVHAATVIGQSKQRARVFTEIYRGKRKTKKVDEIMQATGLSRKQVLTAGKALADHHIVVQTRLDGCTAYTKDATYAANKRRILRWAANPAERDKVATKRAATQNATIVLQEARLPQALVRATQITIDDIQSFEAVASVDVGDPPKLAEAAFKQGVQNVLGERGQFKDWGGERNDLWTTKMKVSGRRRATAFAFKGPATSGKLTPRKLGRNADQIQRLFRSPAEVFLIQYAGQIDESVIEQMQAFAIARSALEGTEIFFGVIDKADTARLIKAYPQQFSKKVAT